MEIIILMDIGPKFYNLVSKSFQNEKVKDLKDALRPVKQSLVGKQGLYAVIDMVNDLKKANDEEVSVVFDIGAAVGEAARPMLKGFPSATVYCFEPFPDSFARLKKRTAPYGDRVKYFNFGLYNRDGDVEFHVTDHSDSNSIVDFSPSYTTTRRMEKIKIRRLDDVVKEAGVTHVDFMKIDVEGAEKQLLEGATETLKMTDIIFIEILPVPKGPHDHNYIEVMEHLYRAGFSFSGVVSDFLFIRD